VTRWCAAERAGTATNDDDPELAAGLNLNILALFTFGLHMHRYATPDSDAAIVASISDYSFSPSDIFLVSDQSEEIHTYQEQGEAKMGRMLTH